MARVASSAARPQALSRTLRLIVSLMVSATALVVLPAPPAGATITNVIAANGLLDPIDSIEDNDELWA